MKSTWSIIFVCLIVVTIGGGSYYSNKKFSEDKKILSEEVKNLKNKVSTLEKNTDAVAEELKSQKSSQDTKTSAQQTANSSNETAAAGSTAEVVVDVSKWRSFTSTKYDYSIKYPADWEYGDNTGGVAMNSIGFRPKTSKEDYLFNVVIEKSTVDYSIALLKKQYAENSTYKGQSTAEINSLSFTTISFENKTDAKVQPTVYLLAQDDLVYYFTGNTGSDKSINAITAEMIKSFQITESTITP